MVEAPSVNNVKDAYTRAHAHTQKHNITDCCCLHVVGDGDEPFTKYGSYELPSDMIMVVPYAVLKSESEGVRKKSRPIILRALIAWPETVGSQRAILTRNPIHHIHYYKKETKI